MPQENTCYLCGAECEVGLMGNHRITSYRCAYCGVYGIHRHAAINHERDETAKWKAACVLAERRLQKLDNFIILPESVGEVLGRPTTTIESLLASYPKTPLELLDRSLLNLSRMVKHPGNIIHIPEDHPTVLFSQTTEELVYVIDQFQKLGYIDHDRNVIVNFTSEPANVDRSPMYLINNGFYIQAEGLRRIDELTRTSAGGKPQAFVAMWFDKSMDDIYDNGIEPAIGTDCGVKCVRMDNIEHNNKICDEIIAEIRKSSFVARAACQ